MRISIIVSEKNEVFEYAKQELTYFIKEYMQYDVMHNTEGLLRFELGLNYALGQSNYHIKGSADIYTITIKISGGSSSAMICGVYEALFQMGIHFGITEHFLYKPFDINALNCYDRMTKPFCRNRGIRQHINFPMDVSSYSLPQAKEYIKKLARMQMNAITFHSYNGQWHDVNTKEKTMESGHFFYGQRYLIPNCKEIKNVVTNKKVHCIPEVEPFIDDEKKRGQFAQRWLKELIVTAKTAGMSVSLSVELPEFATENELVTMLRKCLLSYPKIDSLEWITPEGGGEAGGLTLENCTQRVADLFGNCVLENGVIPFLPDFLPEALAPTLMNLKRAVNLYNRKEEIFSGLHPVDIRIGLYVYCKHTLKIVKQIMNKILPSEVYFSFLAAHGSRAVANNIEFMNLSLEDWQRSLIYSWIEFDGLMYIQQNGILGIEHLLSFQNCESIYGVCLNHWRTEENAITIEWAAKAMRDKITSSNFYDFYADALGVKKRSTFNSSLAQLARLDADNRDNLFNIGFCSLDCWLNPKGLGWIRGWEIESYESAINRYKEICSDLELCLSSTTTSQGKKRISFLINRIECSIIHLKCIRQLCYIASFAKDDSPEQLTDEEKLKVNQFCDEAMCLVKFYIKKHIEQMPDRGCEGTIVSYTSTIPIYIEHVRQYFTIGETDCMHKPTFLDAPPPPNFNYLQ